jgi:hypothetical protein
VGSTAWVTNYNGNSVSACTVSGTKLTDCADTGASCAGPNSIAISDSTAWVTSIGETDSYVCGCTVSGTKLVDCTNNEGFNFPMGTIVDSATVWVADFDASAIRVCTVSGNTLDCVSAGADVFQPYDIAIAGPTAWATSSDGKVWACAITPGPVLSSAACLDSGATFNSPVGIVIVGSTVWVTNKNGNSVSACTISGTKLIDCADSGGTDFDSPVDIAFSVA